MKENQLSRFLQPFWYKISQDHMTNKLKLDYTHGKKFGADAAPSGEAVAFTGGELCDYAFGYAAFPLWVSSCPFLGEHLTYIEGTQRSFR